MTSRPVGLSGLALYLPPYRVDLQQWCAWTDADWSKIRNVVGTGFRLPGPQQSVYTMAANAVLRLIRNYDVDPRRVRYLALGTESSTDNSAGAIIIKGMVDSALKDLGLAPLSRNCEVPEFKHACLGGVYGLKNALRFLATDGDDALAIVVSADKALYERGSSGEPTQGAGAVAMLLSADPAIATIDLKESGTASDYRGIDFRKPLINRNGTGASPGFVDIPVFNGKYSTGCYIDEMQYALEDMYRKRGLKAVEHLRDITAVFMHRPYQRMPATGLGMAYLFALANGGREQHEELAGYCDAAGVDAADFLDEARRTCNLAHHAVREHIGDEVFPLGLRVLKAFRATRDHRRFVENKIELGTSDMLELGNLYTAALPAWLAAGLEQACEQAIELEGREILLIGYGSGDAADAIPMRMVPGWQRSVAAICFKDALLPIIDLSQDQYLALRDRSVVAGLQYAPQSEFIVERVGSELTKTFQDAGVEYYRFIQ